MVLFAILAAAASPEDTFVTFASRGVPPTTYDGFVSVIDADHIWVGLTHTSDGGRTWEGFFPDAANTNFYNASPETLATSFVSDTAGFLRGLHASWVTKDGGHTWSMVTGGPIYVAARNSIVTGVGPDRSGRIEITYSSPDGGATWNRCGESPVSALSESGAESFISRRTGWAPLARFDSRGALGRNGVGRTDDGGCHWRLLSWYDDDPIKSVAFADSKVGWLLPADPGPISRTTDGGFHWRPIRSPVPYFNPMSAYFQDRRHGWLYGYLGAPGGDDSGIYFTSDLGDTWDSVSSSDLGFDRGLAREIPLAWSEGYFRKVVARVR